MSVKMCVNAEGGSKLKVHLPCPVVGCDVEAPRCWLTEFAVKGIVDNKNYVTAEFFIKLGEWKRNDCFNKIYGLI